VIPLFVEPTERRDGRPIELVASHHVYNDTSSARFL
jgi:hypothetical protein